jgi:hypothetical protein
MHRQPIRPMAAAWRVPSVDELSPCPVLGSHGRKTRMATDFYQAQS